MIERHQRNRARELRSGATAAERKLWQYLRSKQIEGAKFRRQVPIGSYIADFACHSHKLIVELDGGQHNDAGQRDYDEKRTKVLKDEGYDVLRFWNSEVLTNAEGVVDTIRDHLRGQKRDPHPKNRS